MNTKNAYGNRNGTLDWPAGWSGLDSQLNALFGALPGIWDRAEKAVTGHETGAVRTRWYEKDDAYLLRFDVPGVRKEDVSLEVEDGILSLSAKRELGEEESKSTLKYERSVELPDNVDGEKIDASYEAGVLSVTLPKSEKAQPRQIAIG